MPTNKHAQLRYQVLDRCFSDFHRMYFIEDLLQEVNDALNEMYGTTIELRQLRDDIRYMRDISSFDAPIVAYPYAGKKSYYRYSDSGYSIFKNELTVEEVDSLSRVIQLFNRFRGLPDHAWLEETLSKLEYRFGVKPQGNQVVSFEQNNQLKGSEHLGALIDAAIQRQPLTITYSTFDGRTSTTIIHPYHLKQYNMRWFLIGLQQLDETRRITVLALDRISQFSRSTVPFIPNTEIDFETYFKDIVGVTLPHDHLEPETIVLRFDAGRFPYVTTKPMHLSQRVVSETAHTIALTVRPNNELVAQILSYGDQVEVLEPQWFRATIAEKVKKNFEKYFIVQNACTMTPFLRGVNQKQDER